MIFLLVGGILTTRPQQQPATTPSLGILNVETLLDLHHRAHEGVVNVHRIGRELSPKRFQEVGETNSVNQVRNHERP